MYDIRFNSDTKWWVPCEKVKENDMKLFSNLSQCHSSIHFHFLYLTILNVEHIIYLV